MAQGDFTKEEAMDVESLLDYVVSAELPAKSYDKPHIKAHLLRIRMFLQAAKIAAPSEKPELSPFA